MNNNLLLISDNIEIIKDVSKKVGLDDFVCRLKDGYDEMTLDVEIAVLTCIYKAYITATSGNMIDEVMNTNKELENKARNLDSEMNREQRRNYNREKRKRRVGLFIRIL